MISQIANLYEKKNYKISITKKTYIIKLRHEKKENLVNPTSTILGRNLTFYIKSMIYNPLNNPRTINS